MLNFKATFSSFSVDDLQKAKQFYSDTLGIEATERPEGLDLNLGSNKVFIYPKDNHEPSTYTVLNFMVENIDEAVDTLSAAGVTFEHYENEFMKTDEKGISRNNGGDKGPTGIAWFKDPAGNFLSVIQE